ncbi:MAG: tRNA preQ1(34) S-adenosylmethionine ribosyltransferase-isomerase QueA [Deltaproteobacteria bacterium]|nr:tRNA preQ1(34) S-adenosylmethionine ribosyltransferase-isomerase QueA [Deltaproteobacteria bacterium]
MSPAPSDFDYSLPQSLIAQEPPAKRGDSKLLVVDRSGSPPAGAEFNEIGRFLPPGALLVANDAKVAWARLLGGLEGSGAKIELLALDPPMESEPGPLDLWCLAKPGRKMREGGKLVIEGRGAPLEGLILAADGPRRLVRFDFKEPPAEAFERLGRVPLPPYIRRPDRLEDKDRYQTVYADSPGAVAAPTAGLHFTKELLEELKKSGRELVTVNLRVGAGTFAKLTQKNLDEGTLHEEWAEVGEEAAGAVTKAKSEGRAIVAVGTTAVRALEWAAMEGSLRPRRGWCSLFIRPGFSFKVVDSLITNFHLPGSSLMYLVAALLGREKLMAAYELAVRERYRFYSYGDAMLIL